MIKNQVKRLSLVVFTTLVMVFSNAMFVAADDLTPRYDPYRGWEYHMSTMNRGLDIDWSHTHRNPGSTTDTVTHSVTRTQSSHASVSSSASFNTMVAEVGVGTEVGLGQSRSITTSITYTIPPYTTYKLRHGSREVKTSGYEVYYDRGIEVKRNWVSGEWTYSGYSDKIKR
ncbi:hypothetical protein [Pontibacillus litoralis]|uniref:Uncharacterized protein n=1 Tax=Pontibacillus litoralis JSM 072002 TaxID=1385512 RepID=A0A0A5FXV2_9BACI|nr:hypothetical protein [Pontibacillus litoralis]KGX84619.1 hypothetical protein N784_12210 [Pontibacillus litoralis JSM 072002]